MLANKLFPSFSHFSNGEVVDILLLGKKRVEVVGLPCLIPCFPFECEFERFDSSDDIVDIKDCSASAWYSLDKLYTCKQVAGSSRQVHTFSLC